MKKRKYNFRSHSTKNINERIEVRAYNNEELEQEVSETSNKKTQDDNHKKSHKTVAQKSSMTLESNNSNLIYFFLLISDIILINILLSCFLGRRKQLEKITAEGISTYIEKRDNARQARKWFI
jgi:hypothetical protein